MNQLKITRRVFFALWPDNDVRLELVKAFNISGFSKLTGQNFRPDNLHLTLHFLGNVSEDKFNCIMDVAEQLESKPFELLLNKFSVFKKAKIFYMGMTDVPDALVSLQSQLGGLLRACDFQAESRTYTPHVTLKRKIQQYEISEKPQEIFWHVEQFALVESVLVEGGVVYKPLKYFNLMVR